MNQFERDVYLPEGTWKDTLDNTIYKGNITIKAKAPIDHIPVFEKIEDETNKYPPAQPVVFQFRA